MTHLLSLHKQKIESAERQFRSKAFYEKIDRAEAYFKEKTALEKKRAELDARTEVLDIKKRFIDGFLDALGGETDFKIQMAEKSALPRLRHYLENQKVYSLRNFETWGAPDFWPNHSILVQHDLSKAFANAENVSQGEYELPYPLTVFEFKISGLPLLAIAMKMVDEHIGVFPFIEVAGRFVSSAAAYFEKEDGTWSRNDPTDIGDKFEAAFDDHMQNICKQIRLLCISLEAQIMVESVKREVGSFSSNNRPGKLPNYTVSTLDLAARHRYSPRQAAGEPAYHKRLHFVRGHWRHYENSRSWVKWHLRGDPDLGFIEKEYKI